MTRFAPIMLTCPLCDSRFQHGPQRYEGKNLILYGIVCCNNR